jgi:hypothetical protein
LIATDAAHRLAAGVQEALEITRFGQFCSGISPESGNP